MHIIHYVCSFNEIDVDNVFIRSNSINISIALITCWLCPCFISGFTYRFYIRFYISVKSIRIYNGIIPLILRICYVQKHIAIRAEAFCSSTWKSYIQCLWMSKYCQLHKSTGIGTRALVETLSTRSISLISIVTTTGDSQLTVLIS